MRHGRRVAASPASVRVQGRGVVPCRQAPTGTLPVVFLMLLLPLLLGATRPVAATCSWLDPHSSTSFDLSSLTRPPQDPYIFPGGNSAYLANVCGIVSQGCPRSPSRKDATGVQLANGHCLAKIGGLVVPSWATVDANDPGKGVKLTYGQGDHCDTIGRPRSMVLEVLCDPAKHKPEIQGGVEGADDNLCTYTLTMHAAAGCPSHVLGTGWTVLIIGGILFSAYCVGGLFWNIKREGLTGADAIPNAKAWRELPSLVADGAAFSVRKVKGLFSKEPSSVPFQSGYDSLETPSQE